MMRKIFSKFLFIQHINIILFLIFATFCNASVLYALPILEGEPIRPTVNIKDISADKEDAEGINQQLSQDAKLLRLSVLNKMTAQRDHLYIESGDSARAGTIEIKFYDCIKSMPHEPYEVKSLIEIWEREQASINNGASYKDELLMGKRIFFGWIFASNPSVSQLEHPIYNVTVIDCINTKIFVD